MALYKEVADRIEQLIQMQAIDKLPSIRECARQMRVSINTIREAYSVLEERQLIQGKAGSGFYLNPRFVQTKAVQPIDPCLLDPREVSLCRINGLFEESPAESAYTGFAIGAASPEYLPEKHMSKAYSKAVHYHSESCNRYIMPPGYAPLRESLLTVNMNAGIDTYPEDIIITSGCHEAIFLALQAVCVPGDMVAIEKPCYFNLISMLESYGLKILEIPSHLDKGMNLDTLEFAFKNFPIKAVLCISNFNNPNASQLNDQHKQKLVQLCSSNDTPLIEDNVYGEFYQGETQPLSCKHFDTTDNVIYCSSFSKTISPGLRIGWVIGGKWKKEIIKQKSLLNVSTSSLPQVATAIYLKEGGYHRHLKKLRALCQQNLNDMRASILKIFPGGTEVNQPKGGFLLWCTLPEGYDSYQLYKNAAQKGILIAPGALFSMEGEFNRHIRFNAGMWDTESESKLKELAAILD